MSLRFRFPTRWSAVVLLALASALPSAAATLKPEMTPEDVANEANARMLAKDWTGYAETFDPAALRHFRDMFAPLFELDDAELASTQMLGRKADEARKLSDREFFAAFVGNSLDKLLGDRYSLGDAHVLGGVPEGADRVHLVVRSSGSGMGMKITAMDVMSLHRTPQGWRLGLSGEMEGMGRAIQEMAKLRAERAKAYDEEDGLILVPPAPPGPLPPLEEERRRQLDEIRRLRREAEAAGSRSPTYQAAKPQEQAAPTTSAPASDMPTP